MSTDTIPALALLCRSYCDTVDDSASATPRKFNDAMCTLLPRIYSALFAVAQNAAEGLPDDSGELLQSVDMDQYEEVRSAMATLYGEYDTYLETTAEEQRYSDIPEAAAVSEGLADVYQLCGDIAGTLRDLEADTVVQDIADRFNDYAAVLISSLLRAVTIIRPVLSDGEEY